MMRGGDKPAQDSLILGRVGNPHVQCSNPANYGCIVRVADVACLATGLVRRDKNQVIIVQLAPATQIRISKLEEKDRSIMVAMPAKRWDLFLSWVNLHEGARTHDRV